MLPQGGTLPAEVWANRHRGILTVLWLHVPGLFLFALARGNGPFHAALEAGVVAVPAVAAQHTVGRRLATTVFTCVGLMTASAVLVHLSGGVVEAHFHFFVMVGIVVLYQDWRPFLIAIAFVVFHHGAMGVLVPHEVYNHQAAWEHPWIWAGIHGVGIVAMSMAGIANWKLNERSQSQLARMAALVESSDDAIYGWALDGTINSWNEGAVQLFGYHAEEMFGRSFSVLMTPAQSAEAERQLESVRRGERVEPFQTERMRKDGSAVEVSVTISAVRTPNGDVVGGATIARDITAWRQADEALRSSEERTRRVIETARDAFVGMDDAGVITDWNRSAEVAFGWSREEALGRSLAETIIPVQHRQAHAEGMKRYQATGNGPVLDGRVEVSGLHRDGHVFPIELAIWQAGDRGGGQQFSAFIQDITDRKRDERERQNTLSLLSATLESTADGILVVEPDGGISSFNGKFAEMWRLPQSVLESGDDRAAMAFVLEQLRDPDAFITKVMELYAQPEAESLDTLHFKDGRVFERTSKPQRVDGAVVGRVWSFHDLTDLKRMEVELAEARDKALETSRLKSEFLATMSHEIRTPMNGVIGLTGLLVDTGLTDTQLQYADGVRRSGEALLAIINDILDFSKIEAGKLELELVDFDLTEALEEVVSLVAEPARAKGLELVVDCRPALPTRVRGDVGRLRQILLNLVSNAIKFTETGEVVLRADLGTAKADDQVVVHVDVVDTGIGIAPAMAERLFEPFSQGDASTTRRYGGTGLGLAICRQLAEAMGGSIGLRSDLGYGSTFWIDLPLGRITEPVRSPAAAGDLLHGVRVLVVDHNQTSRLALASQLLTWDLAADLAPDAGVALERLHHAARAGRPYDVALLDMAMPDMDGLELAGLIRAEPALACVRLVLLSSSNVDAEAAAGAGFSACLTKPVRLSQLHDALVRTLAPPTAEPPAGAGAPPAPPVVSKGRLLVVEDNAINQAVAKGMVARLGYGCDVAGNGIEALEALERQTYQAVLMDCQMPEMDGFEATAEIRRRRRAMSHVPIIAMTAGALVEDRERCLAAGMDDYLPKPIRASELERVLTRWLPETAPAGT